MALFKKSIFEIRSSAQKEADFRAFQDYMFPLGEAQRGWVDRVLRGVPKQKVAPEKNRFVFYLCKETYIEGRLGGKTARQSREDVYRALYKQRFLAPKDNLAYIFAHAVLDLNATCEEDYPTVEQVRALQARVFAASFKEPYFDALPPAAPFATTGDDDDGCEDE